MMKPDIPQQHIAGAKLDHGKIDMSLLQCLPHAMVEVCRVMDFGQTKYSRGGFLEVANAPIRYAAAMLRHYFKEESEGIYDQGDPFYNTEEGHVYAGKIRHDAQVAVNALFRLECNIRKELQMDKFYEKVDKPTSEGFDANNNTIPEGHYTDIGS
ncbi:MAG: dATP/dGTP diphosphohydrolase domain-containing protein [Dehalococcoidales bacterium]